MADQENVVENVAPKAVETSAVKPAEVMVDATKHYLKHGEFVDLKVIEAADFDLYAEPVKLT